MLALLAATLPWPFGAGAGRGMARGTAPATAAIMPVVAARCAGCHATEPGFEGFAEAPLAWCSRPRNRSRRRRRGFTR